MDYFNCFPQKILNDIGETLRNNIAYYIAHIMGGPAKNKRVDLRHTRNHCRHLL